MGTIYNTGVPYITQGYHILHRGAIFYTRVPYYTQGCHILHRGAILYTGVPYITQGCHILHHSGNYFCGWGVFHGHSFCGDANTFKKFLLWPRLACIPRGVYGLDFWESWLKIPLVPWVSIPESARSVQVEEQLAHIVPIFNSAYPPGN